MFCCKCNTHISECVCGDIEERLALLNHNPHVIYKRCRTCGKHYALCKCKTPVWGTSHDADTAGKSN